MTNSVWSPCILVSASLRSWQPVHGRLALQVGVGCVGAGVSDGMRVYVCVCLTDGAGRALGWCTGMVSEVTLPT